MLLQTKRGALVSFVRTDGKSIFDEEGREWIRDGSEDTPGYAGHPAQAAYSRVGVNYRGIRYDTVKLDKTQLQRVCRGSNAIATPATVAELRYGAKAFGGEVAEEIERKSDDELGQMLEQCYMGRKIPLVDPVMFVFDTINNALHPPKAPEPTEEAPPKPTEGHRERRTGRNTPRPRKQEGSLSVALGEVSVLLTPKQLEFMERLSECPGFDGSLGAEYSVSAYAVELEDTMNPMSVGAVVTTLREKGILTTRKCNVGGVKGSMFSLTDMGGALYSKLAERGGAAQ